MFVVFAPRSVMPDTLTRITITFNTLTRTRIITRTGISTGIMLIRMITQTSIHTTDMPMILRRRIRMCIHTAGGRIRICRRGLMALP